MLELRISRRALRSLIAQDNYLRPLNPQAADRLAAEIDRTFRLVGEFPGIGRRIPGTALRLHVTRHFRFRLIYRVTQHAVELREVLHPRQDNPFER